MAYIDNVTNILQIQPDGLPTFVRLSQNENGRNLYFQLAGNEIDIPSNATVTISGTKPDGNVYSGTGSVTDNVVLIPEMLQMTAVAGTWDAKVKITSGGNTIATGRVRFIVDADTVAPGSVPSSSELEGLVAEAQQYAETARTEAYGSPLTAQTAAGMTDHTRVYVYTGSETGYTAGHWYFWNGSAWTDGGIYNSVAVNTDTTLTLSGVAADAKATGDAIEAARVAIDDTLSNTGEAADAKVVGDELADLKSDFDSILLNESSGITGWEQGGIRDSGTLLDSATRIRTASTLQFPENTIGQVNITVAEGFAFGYREYRTAAGTGFISGDYATRFYTGSNNITVDLSHYYKFIIKKTDESAITPDDVDSTILVYSINFIDNTLTTSNKVPDSKAVGDAISAAEAEISTVRTNAYNLLRGTAIVRGADLNDYTTPGTYFVGSSEAAADIINGPITSTSYKLIVENTISTSRIKQTVVINSDKAGFERFYNGTTWSTWKRFAFVEPVAIHPKWEIGNISLNAPWNTNNANVARTALDCIPIGEKTIIRFDPAQIKVSIRLYNQYGKYLVQASGSSTYFNNYDYSADWDTSGEITITANSTIRYYRICAAYISGAAIENPDAIGKLITIEKYGTLKEFCVDMTSVPINPDSAIDRSRPQFGTICAIKELHRQNEQDKTVGYLYRDNKEPFNFYYSSGTPENPKKIFTWDKTKTDTGAREPMDYCFAVTEEGDVIAVFRGEINGNSNQSGPVRGNPIVYPHGDYDHPVVVDLSANIQPTSWLMNTGIYCEHGAMYFVEYTRPRHSKAYLWKVAAPYTSASDWSIKFTYNTTTSGQEGTGDIEHWHHVTRDPFTQIMYASTGDEDFESKILYSTDDGNNWSVLREGDQKICRQLNFVFLKDAVYWATDSVSTAAPRVLCKTTRDANGLLKLSDNDVEILFTFVNYVAFATYHVCYISNPEGLLLLERSDSKNAAYIGTFFFWDFTTARLYYAGSFEPNGSVYVGFRNEAVSHYPALPNDNRVICGFSMFPDEIKYRGNPSVADYIGTRGVILSDAYNDDLYNNLVLEVKPLTDYHYNGNQ